MSQLSKPVRLVLAVGVFGLAGPPIGGLVAWLMMGAHSMRSPLPFMTGSYGEGFVLAVGTGVSVSVLALWLRKTTWPVAIAAALLINAIPLAVVAAADPSRPDLAVALMRVAVVFVPPSLVAAVACWWLTRKLLASG